MRKNTYIITEEYIYIIIGQGNYVIESSIDHSHVSTIYPIDYASSAYNVNIRKANKNKIRSLIALQSGEHNDKILGKYIKYSSVLNQYNMFRIITKDFTQDIVKNDSMDIYKQYYDYMISNAK